MTFDDFMFNVLDFWPEATVEQDNEGQLIVYTNLKLEDGKVVPFEDEDNNG